VTRFETLLVLQALAVAGIAGGLIYYLTQDRAGLGQIASDGDVLDASIEAQDGEAAPAWIPLERVDYVLGPWTTVEGDVLVSVAAGGSPEAYGFNAQPWRLGVEWRDHPFIVCGMYSHLQDAEPPLEPWRLGYCQGVGGDPAGMVVTHVGLFRAQGQEQIRLKLGEYFDVELYQVH
jgi:hypothetical protein